MSEIYTSAPPHTHTVDHTRIAASARRSIETLKQPLILPQYNLYLYLYKGMFLNIMLIRMHCLPNPCPSGLLDPPPPSFSPSCPSLPFLISVHLQDPRPPSVHYLLLSHDKSPSALPRKCPHIVSLEDFRCSWPQWNVLTDVSLFERSLLPGFPPLKGGGREKE